MIGLMTNNNWKGSLISRIQIQSILLYFQSVNACFPVKECLKILNGGWDLQDGRGVRHGHHLPPHKYIKNTSTCGTPTTEQLLNAGRRPQTSQKEQKPKDNLHAEAGPKPKLNPGSCANKEEKGKSLPVASGPAD